MRQYFDALSQFNRPQYQEVSYDNASWNIVDWLATEKLIKKRDSSLTENRVTAMLTPKGAITLLQWSDYLNERSAKGKAMKLLVHPLINMLFFILGSIADSIANQTIPWLLL